VVGGGLPGIYQFEQLHFHWGSYDLRGSEHTIDQVRVISELFFFNLYFNVISMIYICFYKIKNFLHLLAEN